MYFVSHMMLLFLFYLFMLPSSDSFVLLRVGNSLVRQRITYLKNVPNSSTSASSATAPYSYLSRLELNKKLFTTLSSLKEDSTEESVRILSYLESSGLLGTDTVNIMLTHCLKNIQAEQINGSVAKMRLDKAEEIFSKYFSPGSTSNLSKNENSTHLLPSSITLNLMMEGARKAQDYESLLKYYAYFQSHGISPDKYTFSVLVQCAAYSKSIQKILRLANVRQETSSPLLRTGILSMAKAGASPLQILSYLNDLPKNEHPSRNKLSGDVLISALLQEQTGNHLRNVLYA